MGLSEESRPKVPVLSPVASHSPLRRRHKRMRSLPVALHVALDTSKALQVPINLHSIVPRSSLGDQSLEKRQSVQKYDKVREDLFFVPGSRLQWKQF